MIFETSVPFERFGIMLDNSRDAVMTVDSVKRMIHIMQDLGYNMLMLYTEDTYEVKNQPYFGRFRGRYSNEEMNEMDAYAKAHGIELVPCIQTLAHLFTITSNLCGYYVDMDIKKRKLTCIHKGVNTLELEFRLTKNSSFEPVYILGDFGVEVKAHNIIITDKQSSLFWGNVVNQKLPFYAGNIVYECELNLNEDKELSLQVPLYEGSCLEIFIDDKSKGLVFLAPYIANLGIVTKGKHKITIRLLGNRENTFGNPHRIADGEYKKYNWDVSGQHLSFTYRLGRFGILTEPLLLIKKY